MLTRNIFDLPEKQTNHLVHTSNGSFTTNKSTTLPPNDVFPVTQDFLIHAVSNDYDMLIGRKLLSAAKAVIDFETQTVKMFSNKLKLINSNNTPEQNHFQEHPSTQEKHEFEENLFRLNHLNVEEKSKLITLLKKFKNIQYREGENLTCTSQQKYTINTTHNIPIYAKPYGYSKAYESEVENQIQDMLKQKIKGKVIHLTEAPFALYQKN